MKIRYLLILLVLLACGSSVFFKNPIPRQNYQWLIKLDSESEFNASSYYLNNAGLYFNGKMYQGVQEINNRLLDLKENSKNFKSLDTIQFVKHDSSHVYDIGFYKDWDQQVYVYLIAWNKKEGTWKKEFEAIHSFDEDPKFTLDKEGIDNARNLWVQRSNNHDHRSLIEQSYTSDAIYFNNGKVDRGTEEIVSRYAYMSRPNWKIKLTPIKTFAVKEDLIYEIGQYKSNGIGHYIILWKKETNGLWKVSLDFNF